VAQTREALLRELLKLVATHSAAQLWPALVRKAHAGAGFVFLLMPQGSTRSSRRKGCRFEAGFVR
jgi:hypothetical protein